MTKKKCEFKDYFPNGKILKLDPLLGKEQTNGTENKD